jgi:glutathione peroxidase
MTLYDIPFSTASGETTTLAEYRGKVIVIVNVASKCGFTPQYAGLEELYQKYRDQGLVIVGFPCNQFLWQEPGDNAGIQQFCSLKYNVTFPVHAKILVNGPGTHPLYQKLKAEQPGTLGTQRVKWNFTKFLVDRSGKVVARYGPTTTPAALEAPIQALLQQTAPDPETVTSSPSS